MRVIVSASRRTDIPAFYSRWFLQRLREGFCLYPNPFDPRRHHRVDLRPESVLGLVFWTRDARPLLKHLDGLDREGYAYYFQYTINNYPPSLDPGSPALSRAAATFRELAERLGPQRVVWRYDPVILGGEMDREWHLRNFAHILGELGDHAVRVTVSVIDPYRRARAGLRRALGEVRYEPAAYRELLRRLAEEAASRGIGLNSCAEPHLLAEGVEAGRCVDAGMFNAGGDEKAAAPYPLHRQREGCLCHRSVDIGAYDTCPSGCVYCYAVKSPARARAAHAAHDPRWPCLTCPGPPTGETESVFPRPGQD